MFRRPTDMLGFGKEIPAHHSVHKIWRQNTFEGHRIVLVFQPLVFQRNQRLLIQLGGTRRSARPRHTPSKGKRQRECQSNDTAAKQNVSIFHKKVCSVKSFYTLTASDPLLSHRVAPADSGLLATAGKKQ